MINARLFVHSATKSSACYAYQGPSRKSIVVLKSVHAIALSSVFILIQQMNKKKKLFYNHIPAIIMYYEWTKHSFSPTFGRHRTFQSKMIRIMKSLKMINPRKNLHTGTILTLLGNKFEIIVIRIKFSYKGMTFKKDFYIFSSLI